MRLEISVWQPNGVFHVPRPEDVDALIGKGLLHRVLAMTEICFSNSLIEAWWRALKHQWLYLNSLDTVATVTRLVPFYVEKHNKNLPHSAFKGQTPDEMFFNSGDHIPAELVAARQAARQTRLGVNRSISCKTCERNRSAVLEVTPVRA